MSRNDTGIDCSINTTIIQCKLRTNNLTWRECGTFLGYRVIFSNELNKPIIRWDTLIIARNSYCVLSKNLLEKKELFIDRVFYKTELITYCENLLVNTPKYPEIKNGSY